VELPEDLGLVPGMVRDLLEKGDLVTADILLKKAIDLDPNPRLEGELRLMRRKIRQEQFFKTCPVALDVSTSTDIYTFGTEIETRFLIRNLSHWILKIPAKDSWSWLPWAETRDSFVMAHIVITDVNHQNETVSSVKWDEVISFPSTLIVESDQVAPLVFDLKPAYSANLAYRRIVVDAELLAGGLELGGQDFGMMHLPFQRRVLHVFQVEESRTEEPLECRMPDDGWRKEDVLALFRRAVLLEGELKWRGVDTIVGSLPSLPRRGQKLMMIALSLMTGEKPVINVSYWMDWWSAERVKRLPADESTVTSDGQQAARSLSNPSFPAGSIEPINSRVSSTDERFDPVRLSSRQTSSVDRSALWRRELCDPYHGRRNRAIQRIALLEEEALADIEVLLDDPDPMVRKGCVEVLEQIGGPRSAEILLSSIIGEDSCAVLLSQARALAGRGDDLPLPSTPGRQGVEKIVTRFYDYFRLLRSMEEVMHEGAVPGFYDGQFAGFWDVSPSVVDRLKEIALDSDFHYITRVLAVMALSEKKPPSMEEGLAALLIPPQSELNREWNVYQRVRLIQDISEELILEDRDLNLSAYARYSLGKAGYSDAVLSKIREMKDWLKKHTATVDENRIFKGLIGRRLILEQEFSRDLYFDIGYEYQQLDDFHHAEEWYLKLIRLFPESLSVPGAHYNLACLYSIINRPDDALNHLSATMEKGFLDFAWMEKDRDLDNIRSLPAFEELKEAILENGVIEIDSPEEADEE